jgi:predicted DsbA family dithiol-disulfide isomerase
MVKLLNGKDIRTAAKSLEDYRLKMNELEILHGATLTIKHDSWDSTFNLVATRPETDAEMADRLEKARLAAEAKQRREAEKKIVEAKRKEEARAKELIKTKDLLIKMAKEAGIERDRLVDFLNS